MKVTEINKKVTYLLLARRKPNEGAANFLVFWLF